MAKGQTLGEIYKDRCFKCNKNPKYKDSDFCLPCLEEELERTKKVAKSKKRNKFQ